MTPQTAHLLLGVAALAVTLGIMSLTVNRLVRRKLRLSVFLFIVYVLSLLILALRPGLAPDTEQQVLALAKLAFAAAIINALVFSLVNPLRVDRVPDRFPTIVQDALVIGLTLLVSTFLSEHFLTTSAVSAVVIGFALQDTLGNAFAGLAIQSEKPFHVGHWIRVGEFEGRVAEVTWRATKLRTKTGNFVVLPNNLVSKEAITNYSEPALPTRLEVEVGAAYQAAPNQVKAAIMEAMRNSSFVLDAPSPETHVKSFDASAIAYRAWFWVADYEKDELARDEVRTAIYYAFQRHGIEIPWPIQVEYARKWPEPDEQGRIDTLERLLEQVDLFAGFPREARREIAVSTASVVYGDGETIVRQGDPGQSMFVICSGTVSVVLEPNRAEVARIDQGGYFGEMSLLTGDPRSATVIARGDVVVVEIGADLFRRLGASHAAAIEQIAVRAATRRTELEHAKTVTAGTVTVETTNLLTRMKKFLRLN
jgi:small-conductance mechanosensitive channel/CRP-like cAMP-binding protein